LINLKPQSWIYLLVFSITNFTISIIFLISTFLQPSEAERAIVLGFTWARLGMGTIIFLGAAFFSWLIFISLKMRCLEGLMLSQYWLKVLFILALFFFILGTITFMANKAGAGGSLVNYLVRLLPLSIWTIGVGITSMLVIILLSGKDVTKNLVALLIYIVLLLLGCWVGVNLWPAVTSKTEDIYYPFQEGTRIISGQNPYSRIIIEGYMEDGKYPIYFAGFYLLSGLTQKLGFVVFEQWTSLWKMVFLFFSLCIGTILYYLPYKKNLILMSIFSMAFWLLNRWTLHLYRVSEMDFIPLFFLILSLALLNKYPRFSFLVFGLSLSFKQIGIFLVPLYLYWAWVYATEDSRIKSFVVNFLLIAAIPVATTGLFAIWDMRGFIETMLISITRAPAALDNLYPVSAFMNWSGVAGGLPMALLLILAITLSIIYRVEPFRASLIVLLIYIGFNAAFFPSNFIWVVPLLPLSIYESIIPEPKNSAGSQSP